MVTEAQEKPTEAVNPLREGLTTERAPEPHVMVIFGASGDLTRRKLVPALYALARERLLPGGFAVVGLARRDMGGDAGFRDMLREACNQHSRRAPVDDAVWDSFAANIHYVRGSFDEAETYRALGDKLKEIDKALGIPGNRLFYMSTPPSQFPVITGHLGEAGLVSRHYQPWNRVIVEKPFGYDLDSAHQLNRALKEVFREVQIFRIDHYLGKETVQNVLTFRFANGIFEPLWNQRYVEHVQITSAESVGMEGRGAYFEDSGILRDMVQNHLFQVLCLTAMEPPVSMEAGAVRDEKVKVLRSLRPIEPERLDDYVVRAQYVGGHVLGEAVPGYREEPGVATESVTETYVALKLFIDNWRWGNVPFFLRAAKRMPKKVTEIAITFREAPHLLFSPDQGDNRRPVPNVLTIRIQPDEGISLHFGSKLPGPSTRITPVNMEFRYGTAFGQQPPEAYERLILDAMLGDGTLFIRDDETESAWRFVDRILAAWNDRNRRGIPVYPAGTWGPPEADDLAATSNVRWRRP